MFVNPSRNLTISNTPSAQETEKMCKKGLETQKEKEEEEEEEEEEEVEEEEELEENEERE
ncbi:hypothetical protein E2C01_096398 [Portunus trituberculatus]|uniref:Uncharacterized protein n=1 Tax=Portunus trituberculatus TaxID=210409 RepID=A0A5B7JXU7_PORTR|nr:hypothetical protein [Portunus trituberculatus]